MAYSTVTATPRTYKYPHVLGVRLSDDDCAKLQALAERLHRLPSQVIRFLIREATAAEAKVEFSSREQWSRDGICADYTSISALERCTDYGIQTA